ncbi:hypothetical protein CLV70_12050 [Pseudosporangium ferrugineum]|uniref:Uncharacterized protein n=1 Tax=Pseudosporangium ferrugineum TaxID=439699 RepID=A0A2T0RJQ0_9ACTN|nr:hypothetical protein CLV70_12050 [Pseudosporangium ferrugineum]
MYRLRVTAMTVIVPRRGGPTGSRTGSAEGRRPYCDLRMPSLHAHDDATGAGPQG